MKSENGFTLVELLAVIVVLGIIIAIALPNILGLTEKARNDAFITNEKMLISAAKKYEVVGEFEPPTAGNPITITYDMLKSSKLIEEIRNPKTKDPCETVEIIVTYVSEKEYLYTANLTCGEYDSGVEPAAPVVADASGANIPNLATNMIPIYYDTTASNWKVASATNQTGDNQWHDYENKLWANGVMVKETGTVNNRSYYLSASVGTVVETSDILQFYVWIPRFKYRIEDANFHTDVTGTVGIVFETDTATTGTATIDPTTGFEDGEYSTHMAFTFGSKELEEYG